MKENYLASPQTPNKISQLYQQFKVLKTYIDSNKKPKSHLSSTPKPNQLSQTIPIIPVLLATPQNKKSSKHPKVTTQGKNQSGLKEFSPNTHNKRSQKQSHPSSSNRQQLINEYYKHYEYSIKKVMKYKEKSAKKRVKDNLGDNNEDQGDNSAKRGQQSDAIKKLDFSTLPYENKETNIKQYDFALIQGKFEQSLNQIVKSVENNISTKLLHQEQRLTQISSQIHKVKTIIRYKTEHQQISQTRNRQYSVQIDEFNELMSQKDNQSICSQTLDHQIEDI